MPAATEPDQNRRRRARDADEPPERAGRPRNLSVAPAPLDPVLRSVESLLASVGGRERALILTHDNPDPDAIASAVGLAHLLEQRAGIHARLAFGGIVGRAENRALLRVLKLPLVPLARLSPDDFDFVMLVDTQPECGNHSLQGRAIDAAVDHHPTRETSLTLPFADVGGHYGATASIVTSYLRASGLELPRALSTALFYGIKSDTRDLGREFSEVDVDNYHWLFPQVDHVALSQIEHPSVPQSYFAAFHRAYGRARRHDDAVVADLGPVYVPDIVAEVAERFLCLEEMRWTLALGEYEGELFFSLRTKDRRMNAGRVAAELVRGKDGSAGGHGTMAGGRLVVPGTTARSRALFRAKLVRHFLRQLGAPARGQRIV